MLFDLYGDYIFCDGAMGTVLQKNGLNPGDRPDIMNITAPEVVERVHRMYVDAGSNIIYSNTFGANAGSLSETGYSPEEIIDSGIKIAKRAGGSTAKVALDIGPTGLLLEPMGDLEFGMAYELFKQQAAAGEKAGADLAAIETMSDIAELKAAVTAVTENTNLPVLATMTFDKTGRTYLGCTPEDFAETAELLGADAVGINCSLEPAEMFSTVERIALTTNLPLVIKPNAGLPDGTTGVYSIDPDEFARQMLQLVEIARTASAAKPTPPGQVFRHKMILGGCCGTTPDYIRALRKVF